MRRIVFAVMMTAMTTASMAQETYESATIADRDLNGTARYVGMGGALDALGADISTISSNPAGIGLFRRSAANVSFGAQVVEGQPEVMGGKKTTMSFDQAGFVYSMRTKENSYVNFAVNYHKSKNFNQLLSVCGGLNGSSQNKQTFIKGVIGMNRYNYSQIDALNHCSVNGEDVWFKGNAVVNDYFDADNYDLRRRQWGYISNFDFNISGNVNDRIFWGLTFGVKDVNYNSSSSYMEWLSPGQFASPLTAAGKNEIEVCDEREITGTGYNIALGVIARPIESSPFRIGLSISTPTWYRLTTRNYTSLYKVANQEAFGNHLYDGNNYAEIENACDFNVNTPWRFSLSAGHTIGSFVAIGASIDYEDYSFLSNRYRDEIYNSGYAYDDWGYRYEYGFTSESSYPDRVMNDHTKNTLKGVITAKVGAEIKPSNEWAIRLGYNYVSPKYKKEGYKNSMLDSQGTEFASQTDFTNWKATNRLTFGLGWSKGSFSADFAYQYVSTSGEFHPFMDSWCEISNLITGQPETITNYADAVSVSQTRHQLLFTLGYKF